MGKEREKKLEDKGSDFVDELRPSAGVGLL